MVNNQEALMFMPPELLIKRFCQDYQVSETEARERFEEMKKFLFFCANNQDVSYSPSKKIDEMWHQFILHSRTYFDFCKKVGTFLHHEPSEKPEVESYERTLRDMKVFYGSLNTVYWSEGETSAGHCGHCSSCGSSNH
jgi:hypothetical protein